MATVVVVTVLRYFRDRRHAARGGEVRYRVPAGQDPAAVLATLRVEGLSAEPDSVAGDPVMVVSLDKPGARERVREILRTAPANMEGDPHAAESVTFADEV